MSLTLKDRISHSLLLRLFGLFKVPMIAFLKPRVQNLSNESCEIMIPLGYRSKNHLNSMYFGALCAGADIAAGLLAYKKIRDSKQNISLVFKDFQADFLKRPTTDTHFICDEGHLIQQLVDKAVTSRERVHETLNVRAFTPSISADTCAQFKITLSLKVK